MAPEETSTTWIPAFRRAARAAARAVIALSAISPSAVVSEEDPTLTTTRAAAAMAGRGPAAQRAARVPVEDPRVVQLTDQALGARLGACLGERRLHPEPGQPVGQ